MELVYKSLGMLEGFVFGFGKGFIGGIYLDLFQFLDASLGRQVLSCC